MFETTLGAALAGLPLVLVMMVAIWLDTLTHDDVSLVDRFWGAGFVLLGLFWYLEAAAPAGAWLPLLMAVLWAVRYTVYVTWRNWGTGEDPRYAAMRNYHGEAFRWLSLRNVFLLQGAILWVVALPLVVALRDPAPLTSVLLWLGVLVWLVGLVYETVADWQLARFRSESGGVGVCDQGLWRYSRHPNYFGECLVWWGLFLVALAAGGWWTVVSPVLMTWLLLRFSGVPLLEERLQATREGYRDYMARTNAFIPGPPKRGAARPDDGPEPPLAGQTAGAQSAGAGGSGSSSQPSSGAG
ncbi:DUF1295 domain-containing protein [Alkalilimnicola ehrlichii MLHE-1]|uniref:Uncharacterized protein n=1 Tax=Alkalilimnicola ehrlichii (strain ATCC BAA-1101 / DSM 17681 / MLHE-1) TaxID=187272 RepID=Q0AAT9_ALKEH|nr:DUF1295 domain-containing protein [Alkalilimnicola ehrlichii]ABI56048.1 protein of unknown function DUF1295 [Alkalilimnicola ehrlichii MLHE-1]